MPTDWPPLDPASWAPTKRSLHRYAQMLGKLRLALAPPQPNFAYTALALDARGFTTGPIPVGLRTLVAAVDVFAAELIVATGDARERRIPLGGAQTVAGVYAAFLAALAALDVAVSLSPIPQEVPDLTPLDTDARPAVFDLADAARWFAVVSAANAVLDRWRAHFFGRAGIFLWWGGFDLSLMLFSGKRVEPPRDRGYLIAYDLDAEMMNAGFYPGDDTNPPIFYGYIHPQPPSCADLPIAPAGAFWSEQAREWIFPYDAVRASADPEAALDAFLDAIYAGCGTAAGWDLARYRYRAPPLRRAR